VSLPGMKRDNSPRKRAGASQSDAQEADPNSD
jgi:hypothetical protein